MRQEVMNLPKEDEAQQPPWMPILMYHRVVPERTGNDPYYLCATVQEFEAQMHFLFVEGYLPTKLEDLTWVMETGKRSDQKRVVITFDDGYMDVFQYALPILDKYGFPATMFLVTDYLGRSNSWDQGRVEQVPLIGPSEIEQMRYSNISFGSHSRTHRPLSRLASEDIWDEVAGSKELLKNALGIEAATFCYPYGATTAEAQVMVRKAGYLAACGIDRFRHTLFDLSRVDAAACRGTGFSWRLKLSGLHRKLRGNAFLRSLRSVMQGSPH